MTRALFFFIFLLIFMIGGCGRIELGNLLDPYKLEGAGSASGVANLTEFYTNQPGSVKYEDLSTQLQGVDEEYYGVALLYPANWDTTIEFQLNGPGSVVNENALYVDEGGNRPLLDCDGDFLPPRIWTDESGYVKICFRKEIP